MTRTITLPSNVGHNPPGVEGSEFRVHTMSAQKMSLIPGPNGEIYSERTFGRTSRDARTWSESNSSCYRCLITTSNLHSALYNSCIGLNERTIRSIFFS